jgi:hypothetical protein
MPVFWLVSKYLTWLTLPFWGWMFGFITTESRRLVWKMASSFSDRYLVWGARTISKWRPKKAIEGLRLVSIHGSRDLMFPAHLQGEPKRILKGGNHFMVYHRAEEVSTMINETLKSLVD